jgi:RNA recognition motif-containing protein
MAEAENQPTSLYVSNLDTFMTEDLIKGLLSSEKGLTNVKLIRDKTTNALSGYGFLDFTTHADAQAALLKLHGSSLPGSSRILRLNWAQFADRKM